METSKEELQSLNEELTAVNSQLEDKIGELEEANDDLANLLRGIDIATLFLDPEMRMRRFTPAATELFRLIASDAGRPIADVTWQVDDGSLLEDAHRVLEDLVPVEREVRASDGVKWYQRNVLPYRTSEDRIAGVVVTYVEITERKRAEQVQVRVNEELEERVAGRTAELKDRNEELQTLAHEVTMAEERERQRIAQILHDDLQQTLAYVKLRARGLARAEAEGAPSEAAEDVLRGVSDAIAACRALSHELHPYLAYGGDLADGLRQLAGQFGERFGMEVETGIERKAAVQLPEEVQLFAFRAASELLFNCSKHARTSRVHLTMRSEGDCIAIAVEDDGSGFQPGQFKVGGGEEVSFGLSSIRHRARLLGGDLEVDSSPGAGTRCSLTLPNRAKAAGGRAGGGRPG
jgi:two-component system CheB/CheR fusion protein